MTHQKHPPVGSIVKHKITRKEGVVQKTDVDKSYTRVDFNPDSSGFDPDIRLCAPELLTVIRS